MKICTKCGAMNIDRQKVCIMCGSTLVYDIKKIDYTLNQQREVFRNHPMTSQKNNEVKPNIEIPKKILKPVTIKPINKTNMNNIEKTVEKLTTPDTVNDSSSVQAHKVINENTPNTNDVLLDKLKWSAAETMESASVIQDDATDPIPIAIKSPEKKTSKDHVLNEEDVFASRLSDEKPKKKKRIPTNEYDGYYDSLLPEDYNEKEKKYNLDFIIILKIIGLIILFLIFMYFVVKISRI